MMNPAQILDLSALKALAERADIESQGAPWAYEPHGDTGGYGVGVLVDEASDYVSGLQGSCEMLVVIPVAPEVSSQALAAFIAAAHPAVIIALVDECQSLRAQLLEAK